MNTETMLRVLIAAPLESPMPEGLEQWTQISALTSIALSAAIIGAAVLILLKLRRQKRALLGSAVTHTGSLGRRRAADDRAEWIRRTQWALGAAASTNDTMHSYGITILEALARSDLTGPEDKSTLDCVWAGSHTKMRDGNVRHLIAEYKAVIEGEKDESIPELALRRSLDCQDRKENPPAPQEHEATRPGRVSNPKRSEPANKVEVFATLRREILAARLKVTLDGQLGRETSATVKRLAGMRLPPIARPHQRGHSRAEPAGPSTSSEQP